MTRYRLLTAPVRSALMTLTCGALATGIVFILECRHDNTMAAWLVLALGALTTAAAATFVYQSSRRLQRLRERIACQSAKLKQIKRKHKEECDAHSQATVALAFHASHDGVTGLANAALLRDRLCQAIAYADRYAHPVWVLFLDIDHFKFVNDLLGHMSGNYLLKRVAEQLLAAVRASDTVARIGGDEFVLVLSEHHGEHLTEAVLERIVDTVAQLQVIDDQEFLLSCSVGVAAYPTDGANPDDLIKHAGIAMYRAKELGRQRIQFYSPDMNQRAIEHALIAANLRRAVEREEFILHYQPQVDLHTGCITGMEALVRWQHPDLGLLGPERFIGLAEETGLIVPIGAWILRSACRQSQAWQASGFPRLRVAVNLSARQFYQPDLAASVRAVLTETGLTPADLELELTESMVMKNVQQTIAILLELKSIGVTLSIDDFGTGYSSLSYLKRFPVDILKIDQSFVRDSTTDPDDAMIVASIASLARGLQLEVVAEGVETPAQLAFLRRQGCDRVQGFYFSRPLPADAFAVLLREENKYQMQPDRSAQPRQTLLIVDDDSNMVAALRRLLRREDYTIVTAQRASEAFEALALHDVQVILCDQDMPGMSGIDFFDKVKVLYPDTIRIMLTGHADLTSVMDSVNRGHVYRFFTKPWDEDTLRKAIRDAFHHYWTQRDTHTPVATDRACPWNMLHDGVAVIPTDERTTRA